jgi:formate/nitrite transporter FocA (FNT family)
MVSLRQLTTMEGLLMNNIREGLIPTILGSAVTAAGYALKQKSGSNKMIANTVFGFGLAHIVLGAIDLVEHRR